MFSTFLDNVRHNLFKPLLLFFYMGFLVPILRVEFEFPHVIYQGLVDLPARGSIGWHGGEELSQPDGQRGAGRPRWGSWAWGSSTNFVIGILAYFLLLDVRRPS